MKNKNKYIDMIVEVLIKELNLDRDKILYGRSIWMDIKDLENIATSILTKLKRNQVVIAEGRFIISEGEQFGISQRACYIKLSPRKLIGIGALGRRLEEKGVEGKKVKIILETG